MTKLRMKCLYCGHWNRVPVNKIFIEQPSSEPKVRVMIPMYEPLEVVKCRKCKKIIAEPKELIRISARLLGIGLLPPRSKHFYRKMESSEKSFSLELQAKVRGKSR